MSRKFLYVTVYIFLATWSLSACGSEPPPTPTVQLLFATATPGAAAVVSPSASPAPGETPAATPTPSPTITPTPTATGTPIPTATHTPTPVPPTATPTPHAIVNSPSGKLNVRYGPGLVYDPPLGAYNNDAKIELLGQQYSAEGELWWLIPFAGSASGQGWVYAAHTDAVGVDNLPWINPPPPPTPTVTPSATVPPRPYAIVNSPDGFLYVRSGPGAEYQPPLGAYQNGFRVDIIGKQYSTEDEIWWLIPFPAAPTGQGWLYARYTQTEHAANVPWVVAPATPTPTVTSTPVITTTPVTPVPTVTWEISGRVLAAGSQQPVAGAQVEALLGLDAARLQAVTNAEGQFSMQGQARDAGSLVVNINAPGYQLFTLTIPPQSPRQYNLPNLQLIPLNADCRYESVIDVPQQAGLSRLTSLGFTNVITTGLPVLGDDSLLDIILTQQPLPPPPNQLVRLNCALPITLGVGVGQ